jgi:hypothetical protein
MKEEDVRLNHILKKKKGREKQKERREKWGGERERETVRGREGERERESYIHLSLFGHQIGEGLCDFLRA